jgi:hypothetical protein
MSRKISEARKAAFVRAVGGSGNQTLAAERVRVSRSWVCAQRKSDPEFDSAVVAAVASARERLGGAGGSRPPRGWGCLDGVELVVRASGPLEGPGHRRVQIARARVDEWSPALEERFLRVLGETATAKAAYTAVGKSKGSAYTHRRRWPDFARRWQETLDTACDKLEEAMLERASNLFSGEEAPADCPVRPITVGEAIWIVEMHKRRTARERDAPGLWPLPRPLSAFAPQMMRKLRAIERKWKRREGCEE